MTHRVVHATPTITAGAYSSGDAVGGLLEFENVRSAFEPSGCICKALLKDNAKQSVLMSLALFDREFTPTADNAAFDVSDSDLENLVTVLKFEAADYAVFANNSVGLLGFDALQVKVPFVLVDGGTSLFGQLYVTATPTYVATDDLHIELVISG